MMMAWFLFQFQYYPLNSLNIEHKTRTPTKASRPSSPSLFQALYKRFNSAFFLFKCSLLCSGRHYYYNHPITLEREGEIKTLLFYTFKNNHLEIGWMGRGREAKKRTKARSPMNIFFVTDEYF